MGRPMGFPMGRHMGRPMTIPMGRPTGIPMGRPMGRPMEVPQDVPRDVLWELPWGVPWEFAWEFQRDVHRESPWDARQAPGSPGHRAEKASMRLEERIVLQDMLGNSKILMLLQENMEKIIRHINFSSPKLFTGLAHLCER